VLIHSTSVFCFTAYYYYLSPRSFGAIHASIWSATVLSQKAGEKSTQPHQQVEHVPDLFTIEIIVPKRSGNHTRMVLPPQKSLTIGIVNLMQRWVYFLWKVGKRERFWSLFARRSIRNPLKNLLSGESSSRENFQLTILKVLLKNLLYCWCAPDFACVRVPFEQRKVVAYAVLSELRPRTERRGKLSPLPLQKGPFWRCLSPRFAPLGTVFPT
jgi:hypothetical protein